MARAVRERVHAWPGLLTLFRRIGVWDLALLGGVAAIVAIVGTVALLSPPNTWDVFLALEAAASPYQQEGFPPRTA